MPIDPNQLVLVFNASCTPVGAGSILPFPTAFSASGSGQHAGWFPASNRSVRFDDLAVLAVSNGLVEAFKDRNRAQSPMMRYPRLQEQLDGIHQMATVFPTKKKKFVGEYGAHIEANGCSICVFVVEDLGRSLPIPVPAESVLHLAQVGPTMGYKLSPVHMSAKTQLLGGILNVPDWRMDRASKKVRLPGSTTLIEGPYLVVALVEDRTGFALKMRLFPIWLAPRDRTMAVLRSNPERQTMSELYKHRIIALAPVHISAMVLLERIYGGGRHWRGQLTAYTYHADFVVFPRYKACPFVVEVFAMHNVKRYLVGKKRKRDLGQKLGDQYIIRFVDVSFPKSGDLQPMKRAAVELMENPAVMKYD